MKLDIQREIRVPKDPSSEWPRYKSRGYSGQFTFDVPGYVVLPVGERVPVTLYGGRKPVGTAKVTQVWLGSDTAPEAVTTVFFDEFREGPAHAARQ